MRGIYVQFYAYGNIIGLRTENTRKGRRVEGAEAVRTTAVHYSNTGYPHSYESVYMCV